MPGTASPVRHGQPRTLRVPAHLRAPLVSRLVGQRLRMLASKPNQEDLQVSRELVEAGKLRPLVGRTYPLGEVREAMRALEAGSTRGKIVITV